MHSEEFQEIAHCGGKVTITVSTKEDGQRQYQITVQHCAPVPAAFFAVYALPQGIPVGTVRFGGLSDNPSGSPQGLYQVFIASDSEGMFGCSCPACGGYWRTNGQIIHCPYCGISANRHDFLTEAQRHYINQYCELMNNALDGEDGDHVINWDAISDATGRDVAKPPFYYAEERQQTKFTCEACGTSNDILGNYGYCTTCFTRNDMQQLQYAISQLRDRINAGGPYEGYVREVVTLFDSFTNQLSKELLATVPLTPARHSRIQKRSLHKLNSIFSDFQEVFDINVFSGMTDEDKEFAALMFYRRNVYEHNGGEVDEQYLKESGDTSVKLKQALHETQESVHRFANIALRMASNLHQGFHTIFPPEEEPIKSYAKRFGN